MFSKRDRVWILALEQRINRRAMDDNDVDVGGRATLSGSTRPSSDWTTRRAGNHQRASPRGRRAHGNNRGFRDDAGFEDVRGSRQRVRYMPGGAVEQRDHLPSDAATMIRRPASDRR